MTPSLRHCSNKYKLAREGEKDEDLEKGKVFLFCFFCLKGITVTTDTMVRIKGEIKQR